MVYQANGLNAEALEVYQRVIKIDPENPKQWFHLARVHQTLADPAAARDAYKSAMRLGPTYVPARRRLGFLLIDLNDLGGAQTAFEGALQIEPNDIGSNIGLALIWVANHEDARAVSRINHLLNHTPPSSPSMTYLRQLLTAAKSGGTIEPPDVPDWLQASWPDPWTAEVEALRTGHSASLERIESLLSKGKPLEAIPLINELLKRKPNDLEAMNLKAAALFALGHWNEGIGVLQDALRLDGSSVTTRLNLSRGYEGRNQLDQALAEVRETLRLNGDLAEAHAREGELLVRLNQPEEAIASLERAATLNPSDFKLRMLLGQTLLDGRKWQQAEAAFLEATQLDPDSTTAHINLAMARAQLGRFKEAHASLIRARALNPSASGLISALAKVRQLEFEARGSSTR